MPPSHRLLLAALLLCATPSVVNADPTGDDVEAAEHFIRLLKKAAHQQTGQARWTSNRPPWITTPMYPVSTLPPGGCNKVRTCGVSPTAPNLSDLPPPTTRIWSGQEAVPHSWPWQVSLREFQEDGFYHACGGSVIHEQWVITAAHCFNTNKDVTKWKVVAGGHSTADFTLGQQTMNVRRIIVHPDWLGEAGVNNDIALMELSSPMQYGLYVQPICITNEVVTPGTVCWTSGWGLTATDGDSARLLQQVAQVYISFQQCQSLTIGPIDYTLMCAGQNRGRRTCEGDSGGPLVCRKSPDHPWTLQGLTSFGDNPASNPNAESYCGVATNNPSYYTNVPNMLPWVQQHMGVDIAPVLLP